MKRLFSTLSALFRRWSGFRSKVLAAIFVSLIVVVAISVATARAAAVLTIEQITWSIVGLDSNNVNAGANEYPVGVRVCNLGDTPMTGYSSNPLLTSTWTTTFAWTVPNATYFTLVNSSTVQTFPALVAGDCQDVFYAVRVTRDAAAYGQTASWNITVASPDGTVSTGQQLKVEYLISQNRNSTLSIAGPTKVQVGKTYQWVVTAFTATQGYDEIEHYLTFCPGVYRLDSVIASYTAPAPATDDVFWQDGCGWDSSDNVGLPSRQGCLVDPGIKYGGDIVYTYNVEIVGAGACTLQDMVYDFSGSSFHYNSDYPNVSLNVVAYNPACATGVVYKEASGSVNGTYNVGTDTPLANFGVSAVYDTSNNGIYDIATDPVTITTTTDVNGNYTICVEPSATNNYLLVVNTSDPAVSTYTLHTGVSTNPFVWPPTTVNTTANFDFDPPGAISGYLYQDANLNTVYNNPGETPISGQMVTIYKDDGDGIYEPGTQDIAYGTAITNVSGQYVINGLPAGSYWVDAPNTVGGLSVETTPSDPRLIAVTSGVTNSTNTDFGYVIPGAITGTLYKDDGIGGGTAGNNTFDEPATSIFSGTTVSLYIDNDSSNTVNAGDTLVGTTTTNSSGLYTFSNVAPGTKYLVSAPANIGAYTVGTTNPLSPITVTSNTTTSSNNVGYDAPTPGTITGTVYEDTNLNNSYLLGETLLNAVTISLYTDDGDGIYEPGAGDSLTTTAASNASGIYTFSGLGAGTYWLDPPATDGGSRTIGTTEPIKVTLTTGSSSGGNDFGYDPAVTPGSILGYLYYDSDANDSRSGEASGNTFTDTDMSAAGIYPLLYTDDGDGVYEPGVDNAVLTATATWQSDDQYIFSSVNPGTYWVLIDSTDSNYNPSGSAQYLIGTQDPLKVIITSGLTSSNNDFGYDDSDDNDEGTIRVTVFKEDVTLNDIRDSGESGASGVTVKLYRDTDNDGVIDDPGEFITSAVTDINGQVSFPNLVTTGSDKDYIVTVTSGVPAGYTIVTSTSGTLTPTSASIVDYSFNLDPTGATITGKVFADDGTSGGTLSNGTKDGGEVGLAGITITLTNTTTSVVTTTTTAADGSYSFAGQTVGNNYTISVPTTTTVSGSTYSIGTTNPVTITSLTAGTTTRNFGFDPPGTINGIAWYDDGTGGGTAADDTKNGAEGGISPSLTVTLYNDLGTVGSYQAGTDTVVASTSTTAITGAFSFSNLVPGNYIVSISSATSGTYVLPTSQQTQFVTINPDGSSSTSALLITIKYPYDPPGAISGTLVKDDGGTTGVAANISNNAINGDEGGVSSGITVTLKTTTNGTCGDGDDVTVTSTTTNASGGYSFTGVSPATNYCVIVDAASQTVGNYKLPTAELNAGPITVISGATTGQNFYYDPLITVSGTVFRDEDLSNVQNGSEAGIPNITVTLKTRGTDNNCGTGDDVTVSTASTNSTGAYSFANVAYQIYCVDVDQADPDLPANYAVGTPDPVTISSPALGTNTVNFGFDPPGTISGTVFRDEDLSNAQNGAEAGIPNITVTMYNDVDGSGTLTAGDTIRAAVSTNASGGYSFTSLPTGTNGKYLVDVDQLDPDLPTGYTIGTPDPVAVNPLAGNATNTVNFGFDPPSGSAGGTLFQDDAIGGGTFGDGVNDAAGEAGIASISITLYRDVNVNGILDASDTVAGTTTSAAGGTYNFTGLAAGQYLIDVNELDPDVPATYTLKTTDPKVVTVPLNAAAGATDFGFVPPPVIKGTIFYDLDGDGIQDAGEMGIPGVTVTIGAFTVTTDANGDYFADQSNGLAINTTYAVSTPGTSGSYTLNPLTPATSVTPTVLAGVVTVNFGYTPPAVHSISGTLWVDTNGNAVIEAGEPRADTVTVTLKNAASVVIATTTTDASGGYLFSNVPDAAGYSVTATTPAASIPTGSTVSAGMTNPITGINLAGANITNQNIGFQPPAYASITGIVFNDDGAGGGTSSNGVKDGTEAGLAGVTITLYLDNGDNVFTAADTLVTTTVSDASGAYTFSSLTPGSYWVIESDPVGYTSTSTNQLLKTVIAGGSATANFGDIQPTTSSITGVVYLDANSNSTRDPGEIGLAGVTVKLTNSFGTVLATTTTDAGGAYSFTNLIAGQTYTVVETDPSGYSSTTSNSVNRTTVSNAAVTADFGDKVSLGGISGTVFNDNGAGGGVASSGTQTGTEPGISGVTVQVYRDNNGNGVYDPAIDTLVSTTTTNASGGYTVANLTPGSYIVIETDPSGYISITPNQLAVTVTGGALTTGNNFADLSPVPAGTISGTVWNDLDSSGTMGAGENGLSGIAVALYRDVDGNGTIGAGDFLVSTRTTDAGGAYSFLNLAAGNYIVVETDPSGYTSTTPNLLSSTTTPALVALTGSNSAVANFGDLALAGTVTGTVFVDANSNSIKEAAELILTGVVVTLRADTNGNGILDPALDTVIATTTTNGSGVYAFSNIIPGNYLIIETDPSGYTSTTSNVVFGALTAGGSLVGDFGDITAPPGTISGIVWNDANSTGGIDAGEAGIAGVTVTLRNAANVVIATATSDAGGAYSFLNVPAGNYTITETDLAGYTSTTSNTLSITLGAGSTSTGNNFGDIPNPGAISGTVWNDVNGNGVINAGESGISGVTLSLYRDVNANGVYDPGIDTLSATTTTGGTGAYSFPSNTPGSYLVIETDPSGYVSTTSNIVPLIVAPGNTKIANFGESSTLPSGTIAGVVFLDANTSGSQNAGESGVGSVTVTLLNSVGTVVSTTTTLADGSFSFAGVGAGSYTVNMTTPGGYSATTSTTSSVVMLGGGATVAFGINQPVVAAPSPPVAAKAPGSGGGIGILFSDPPLTKSASVSLAHVGDVVTFTATAFNPNAVPFTNAVFTDSMPSQLTIQSVTSTQGAVTVTGQTVTVNIGTMAAGQTVTITMVTVVNASAVAPVRLRNTATLSTDQGTFSASAEVSIEEGVKPPLLPDTGQRPLWIQFAGPLVLLLLAGVLIGVGNLLASRRLNIL